jgi:hypothetical protein
MIKSGGIKLYSVYIFIHRFLIKVVEDVRGYVKNVISNSCLFVFVVLVFEFRALC